MRLVDLHLNGDGTGLARDKTDYPTSASHCAHCEEAIVPGDLVAPANDGAVLFHTECMLRMVVASVGHQLGRCSCHGGTEDDPPGMTVREAALAAVELYERNRSRPAAEGNGV
jgi:hypothetical protein